MKWKSPNQSDAVRPDKFPQRQVPHIHRGHFIEVSSPDCDESVFLMVDQVHVSYPRVASGIPANYKFHCRSGHAVVYKANDIISYQSLGVPSQAD